MKGNGSTYCNMLFYFKLILHGKIIKKKKSTITDLNELDADICTDLCKQIKEASERLFYAHFCHESEQL